MRRKDFTITAGHRKASDFSSLADRQRLAPIDKARLAREFRTVEPNKNLEDLKMPVLKPNLGTTGKIRLSPIQQTSPVKKYAWVTSFKGLGATTNFSFEKETAAANKSKLVRDILVLRSQLLEEDRSLADIFHLRKAKNV